MRLTISTGNSKLGSIPNISLMPILSCPPGVPCAKLCYCNRALVQYPAVRRAWGDNQKLWEQNPESYFKQLRTYLGQNKPELFRLHVAGDIPSFMYWIEMQDIAFEFRETRFLCYTKNYEVLEGADPKLLDNLTTIVSIWPGLRNPEHLGFRRAWLSHDPRTPLSAFPCPGHCHVCGYCWGNDKTDVQFKLH